MYPTAGENARMSRPNGVTGCESDEISQKMCLGDAVGRLALGNIPGKRREQRRRIALPDKIQMLLVH